MPGKHIPYIQTLHTTHSSPLIYPIKFDIIGTIIDC